MMKQPALFVSHGSPMIVIDNSPARTFLEGLAGGLPARPDAIVLFSAHHDEPVATITAAARPETIHDFGGFPAKLYTMRYPAPGMPELAGRVASRPGAAASHARGATGLGAMVDKGRRELRARAGIRAGTDRRVARASG